MQPRTHWMRMAWRALWPACLVLGVATATVSAQDTEPAQPYVVVCPIDEMVDQGLDVLVGRAVEEARGAEALILEVNTFGGRVDSAIAIAEKVLDVQPRTIAYVTGKGAISAGALISFSCDSIVMERGTNIGASTPVFFTSEGSQTASEKEVSFLRSKFQSYAEVNGHNPALGQAMVDKDIELWARKTEDGTVEVYSPDLMGDLAGSPKTGTTKPSDPTVDSLKKAIEEADERTVIPLEPLKDFVQAMEDEIERRERENDEAQAEEPPAELGAEPRLILAAGKLLTLSSNQAEALGLSDTTVHSLDQVLGFYDLEDAEVRRVAPNWEEETYRWLTSPMVSSILMMMGIIGLYMELQSPGLGLPGVLSVVGFSLFFGSRMVLGLSDWIDIVLVVIGVALLAVEMFVLPGFGVAGLLGILFAGAGLVLSFTLNDFEIPQYSWQWARWQDAVLTLGLTVVLTLTGVLLLARFLKYTPAYGRLVLADAQTEDQGYIVQSREDEQGIGQMGVATTVLRPTGKARFGDRTMQVVSRADYIEKGEAVVVVEVEGNRYVVDRVAPDAMAGE